MRHLTYLAVLGGCLLCVTPLAVVNRHVVWCNRRRFARSLLVTFVVFTAWDVYAIHAHQWSFDRSRTVGWLLPGRLPVEEALFFIVIPLCVVLTFETVGRVLSSRRPPADPPSQQLSQRRESRDPRQSRQSRDPRQSRVS
jgi:lycopene cyclase domain-containing protein